MPVCVSAAKQRALLAMLILHAGKTLILEQLTDAVWDEQPPRDTRGAIQAYVMRLRHTLSGRPGPSLIRTVPGGYLLDVEQDAVDVARFRRLTRQAERTAAAGDLGGASGQLAGALKLWRGRALEDVESESLHRSEAVMLAEQRLLVSERRIEFELALGHHREVIAELNTLVGVYPLRERYWYLLMLALSESGWRADALAAYRRAQRLFTAELGIEPGNDLRGLHDAILADRPVDRPRELGLAWRAGIAQPATQLGDGDADGESGGHQAPAGRQQAGRVAGGQPARREVRRCRSKAPARGARTGQPHTWIRQCQLPRDVSDFVGRVEASEMIVTDLSGARPAVPVVALSGPAGVGKTALAVRVAHRVRRQFPDGQLYLRLGEHGQRSHGLSGLLADLMRATGRPRGSIPEGLDQRAAAFRAWLADRRVLLVVEDAAGTAQVRPLLPGTPGSAVILTSRPDLRALTVLDGAHHYAVGALQPAEALELLDRTLGSRAAAEPAAAAELAALCGYLPLALRIAAVSLDAAPELPLRSYVARLRRSGRLSALRTSRGGGPQAIQAVFGGSSGGIDPAQRRLLSLLADLDFTPSDVAALLSTRTGDAARLLEQLTGPASINRPAPDKLRLPTARRAEGSACPH
jgi:DNA-binding SARP family transcriptional activator